MRVSTMIRISAAMGADGGLLDRIDSTLVVLALAVIL